MTETSAEAMEIAEAQPLARVLQDALAAEIDSLCNQRVAAERERILRWAEDHYWDSLEREKTTVLTHLRDGLMCARPVPESAAPTKDYVQQAREIVDRATRNYSTEMMSEDWERGRSEIDRDAVIQEIATALASGLAIDLARPRCSTPSQEDTAPVCGDIGALTRHVSGDEDGDTVGYEFNLGNGRHVWCGELSKASFSELGPDEQRAMGNDFGWFIVLYERDGRQVLGKAVDEWAAQKLVSIIGPALLPPKDAGGPGSASNTESSPTQTVAAKPEQPRDVNVIGLGSGRFVINFGHYASKPALFIEPAPIPGVVGEDASESGLDKAEAISGGTVITFDNAESASVLRDQLEKAIPNSTQTVAAPGPTAGDVERARKHAAKLIGDWEDTDSPSLDMLEHNIAVTIRDERASARAELLAEITDPSRALIDAVGISLEKTATWYLHDRAVAALKVIALKLGGTKE